MKKISAGIILIFSAYHLYCQDTQWASRVISYSSQLSDYAYSATQILGRPNVLPNGGDNPNAWMPSRSDRIEEIKVGFANPMKIQQIAVAESFHPGSLYRIYLYDINDNEHLLANFTPHVINIPSRLINIYINETSFKVNAIKIVLNCNATPGYNAIDAIGIRDTKDPIRVTTNMAFRINPGQETSRLNPDHLNDSSEYRPVISDKLNELFFTRKYNPENSGGSQDPEDIWYAAIDGQGNLENPRNMGKLINNEGPNTIGSIAIPDGKLTMVLGNAAGKNGKLQSGVYYTQWNGSDWSAPAELKINNAHIGSWDADYCLAENGNILFIATERYDTQGGKDLYISRRIGKENFSEPVNLGPDINKAGDEECPFYDPDNNLLFFATAGLTGFGNFDIFKTSPLDSSLTRWSEPENIGSDINSPANEKYFSYTRNGKYAYFVRDADDSQYRLYKVPRPEFIAPAPLVTVKGKVTDQNDNPLNGQISFLIMPEGIEYGISLADSVSGEYEMPLPSGNDYRIKATAEGYDSAEVKVSLENKEQAYVYDLSLTLNRKEPEMVAMADTVKVQEQPEIVQTQVTKSESPAEIKMESGMFSAKEILFPFDSDIPVKSSLSGIDKSILWLKNHGTTKVEITGYADPIGNEKYNLDLSLRRANWVKNYMVERGVGTQRITVHGIGEKLPSGLKADSAFKLRRRVEFEFLQ